MFESDADKWDRRYRQRQPAEPAVAWVLREYAHLLPVTGRALDLAAGLGGNALFLASRGLATSAWDISAVAMDALAERARKAALAIDCQVRDAIAEPPAAASFEVIVVSRFLHRGLCPRLASALTPGGLLYYETWCGPLPPGGCGPSNPAYRLQEGELARLFPELATIAYREHCPVPGSQLACILTKRHL